jgi:hypothetical protein
MYQYGNTLTAVVWEGVIHKGIVLEDLRYMEGDVFLDREYLPHGTVIVVKKGTRLHGVCGVEGELDLGWVKLIGAGTSCQGLPEYRGTDLEGTLWLKEYRNTILVVSQELWEEHLDEVGSLLFSRGMAWSDTWTFQCHEASEWETFVDVYTTLEEVGEEFISYYHIHVGSSNRYIVDVLKDKVKEFILVLDDFLGEILRSTLSETRCKFDCPTLYELKDHGWEYKIPALEENSKIISIAQKLVKGLVLGNA